jgi:hypothetical protein
MAIHIGKPPFAAHGEECIGDAFQNRFSVAVNPPHLIRVWPHG